MSINIITGYDINTDELGVKYSAPVALIPLLRKYPKSKETILYDDSDTEWLYEPED
jgi:hypothetical protein